MNKVFKYAVIIAGAAGMTAVSSCSGGANATASGGGGNITNQSRATIGQMSVIPLLNQGSTSVKSAANNADTLAGGSYKLAITNNKSVMMLIDSIAVTGHGASSSNVGNGSCGNKVQGNNTCYLDIMPPASAGSFVVTVNYHYADNTPGGKLSQLIQYGPVTANNGFYYQSNNDRVVTAIDQTRVLSFPIILAADYKNLATTSNSTSAIDCGGGSYTKGTACTLTVATRGSLSNNVATVSLRGTLPDGSQNTLTLNTIVSANPEPNLIVGGTGLVINPANGQSANQVEVTVMNSGNSDATDLTITPNSPLTVATAGSSFPCASTLAADDECTFFVNAESIISGQNSVTITDAEGDSQLVNVIYVAESASPSLTISSSGTLINTIAGYESQLVTITLTNNSTAATPLTNLKLSSVSGQNSYMNYTAYTGAGAACYNSANPSGVTTLAVGSSCSATISYNPPLGASLQSGSIVINPVATYVDSNNVSKTYSQASLSINYSSTSPVVTITMTAPPNNSQNNPYAFVILPNGIESQAQLFTFTNTGNVPANLITFNNVLPGYPDLASVNVSVNSGVASPCTTLATLNPGASCSFALIYGPVSSAQDLESVGLAFRAINSVTSDSVGPNYYISVQALDTKLALDSIAYSTDGNNWSVIESTTDLGGASGNPLTFTNYQAHPVYLRYSYLNDGNESAFGFNVNLNNIPTTYAVVSGQTTCPYGANTATLNPGDSCDVVLKTVDYSKSAIYSNGAGYISGQLNINTPTISYTSPNTGVHRDMQLSYAPTASTVTYLTANRFASLNISSSVLGDGDPLWYVNITPASTSFASSEVNTIVNLDTMSWGSAFESYTSQPTAGLNPNNWNIYVTSTSITFTFDILGYMPTGTYTFPYTVTSGYDPSTSYTSTIAFTLNN